MNIIFMGTPDFAVPSLEQLLKSKHKIVAVVTSPDKPRGRGLKLANSPIKQVAIQNRIPVLQPEDLNDPAFDQTLRTFTADLFVVVAFRILPKHIYSQPRLGSVNLHASLLPKYRGAAPIQWVIINGEKETGVTTFFIEENVDTGHVILQHSVVIPPFVDAGELSDILKMLGANVLNKTVDQIQCGKADRKPQIGEPSFAPKITKRICQIDWTKSGKEIVNLIRGLSPRPGAFTHYDGKIIKIYHAEFLSDNIYIPGKVHRSDFINGLIIGCGSGAIRLTRLQLEAKKIMTGAEYLRGHSIPVGTSLS